MPVNNFCLPLFSIVIPTFNRPKLLGRAIDSVLAQTLQDFEIIVVDDGSLDRIEVRAQAHRNDRARLITNEINRGAAEARNIGIRHSRGKFISFLDDDDELLPDFLANTANVLADTPPSVGFSWTNVEFLDYLDSGIISRQRRFAGSYSSESELFTDVMSIGSGFGVTIKAECFDRVGEFDRSMRLVEDTDLFLRLLAGGYSPTLVPTYGVRIHNHRLKRMTAVSSHSARLAECEVLLERHTDFLDRYPVLRRQLTGTMNSLRSKLRESQSLAPAVAYAR